MTEDLKPWERLPRETDKAWAAFQSYRDTPAAERNVRKLNRESNATTAQWALKYHWTERAQAWDAEQDRVAGEARLSEIDAMNRRHIQIARGMVAKAAERRQGMTAAELTPTEVRRYFDSAARLERLASGEAESRAEVGGTVVFRIVRDAPPEDDPDGQ